MSPFGPRHLMGELAARTQDAAAHLVRHISGSALAQKQLHEIGHASVCCREQRRPLVLRSVRGAQQTAASAPHRPLIQLPRERGGCDCLCLESLRARLISSLNISTPCKKILAEFAACKAVASCAGGPGVVVGGGDDGMQRCAPVLLETRAVGGTFTSDLASLCHGTTGTLCTAQRRNGQFDQTTWLGASGTQTQ